MSMLFYASTIVLSFMAMITHLHPALSVSEIACASIPVGTVGGAWLVFLVSMLLNFLSDEAVLISKVIMLVVFLLYLDPFVRKMRMVAPGLKTERGVAIWLGSLLGVTSIAMVPLYMSRFLATSEYGDVLTGGSTWADLPIHLHIANSFLYGRNRVVQFQGMHSPVFAGEPMKYPFIPDFHAAALVKMGASMRNAMWVPGAALFISFVGLLFLFNYRVTRSKLAALISVPLVLFAGGYAGFRLFMRGGFEYALNKDPIQDDTAGDGSVFWFGFISHVMIPQRGATFAYPLVLVVLLLIWVSVRARSQQRLTFRDHVALMTAAGLFTASLPLVQAHACVGLGIYVLAMFILDACRIFSNIIPYLSRLALNDVATAEEYDSCKSGFRSIFLWIIAGVVVILGAYPQAKLFIGQATSANGFFQVVQVFKGGLTGFVSQWWLALGPSFFLFAYAGFNLFKSRFGLGSDAETPSNSNDKVFQTQQIALWVGATVCFLFGNFVKMQPWDRDNVKLFYVWLFPAAGFIAALLTEPLCQAWELLPKSSAPRQERTARPPADRKAIGIAVLAVVAMFLMTFAGTLSYVRETRSSHVLYGPDEIKVGEWIRDNTRPEAVILTKDTHRSPAGFIAGRPSLVAYAGWMWSHGYDYQERHNNRETILSAITKQEDSTATYLLYRWGVKYVLYEAPTAAKEPLRALYLGGHVRRVFQVNRYHVFRVKYDGEEF